MKNALDFMQELVDQKVRESGGKNRSPVIDAINRELGLPMGSPYCAATVSHCFREAFLALPSVLVGTHFPYSGSSQWLKAFFKARGLIASNPQDLADWKGALGGWTDEKDHDHGHVFFIKGRLTNAAGAVIGLDTLEANTSPQTMERDGEGIFELHRTIESLRARHPDFWFLRTDRMAGGAWWI